LSIDVFSPNPHGEGCARKSAPSAEIRAGLPASIVSEPSVPGSIKIPADAQPMILIGSRPWGAGSFAGENKNPLPQCRSKTRPVLDLPDGPIEVTLLT
jgi:hypothetical protein